MVIVKSSAQPPQATSDWRKHFPELARSRDRQLHDLLDAAPVVRLAAGQFVFHAGSPCQNYLLVLEGSVRVQVVASSGREATLYRVGPGHSCVLTTSCLLGNEAYPAAAVTESPVAALALSGEKFQQALDRSHDFRSFAFSNLGHRLVDVIRKIEDVTFGLIDQRLARTLNERSVKNRAVTATHEALALELGTAREVVSRHLKVFEEHGWVKLGRGKITVIDGKALSSLEQHL